MVTIKLRLGPTEQIKLSETRIDLPLSMAAKMKKDAEIEIITNESISIISKIDEKAAELATKAA